MANLYLYSRTENLRHFITAVIFFILRPVALFTVGLFEDICLRHSLKHCYSDSFSINFTNLFSSTISIGLTASLSNIRFFHFFQHEIIISMCCKLVDINNPREVLTLFVLVGFLFIAFHVSFVLLDRKIT